MTSHRDTLDALTRNKNIEVAPHWNLQETATYLMSIYKLRCGGGKALTKHTIDEATLKCHVTVEGANKVSESVTKIMDNNALVICDVNVSPEREDQLETTPIETGMKSKTDRLGKIMPELYNLENGIKSEKPVKIDLDLDLYQMENF
jgi:hypothetical protein